MGSGASEHPPVIRKQNTSGLVFQQMQRQRQNQSQPLPNKGKSHGQNILARPADGCRQNSLDRAVVVIDGMTE